MMPGHKRDVTVLRMRQAGLTYAEIGARLGVCMQRAEQIAKAAPRRVACWEAVWLEHPPAIEDFLEDARCAFGLNHLHTALRCKAVLKALLAEEGDEDV